MSIRRRLALWLCPELKHECAVSWSFRFHVEEYRRWLCIFPDVAQVLKSLHATVLGSGPINAGTPAGDEVCTVGGLREQLLRMKGVHQVVHQGERIIPAADNACRVNSQTPPFRPPPRKP